MRRVFPMKPCKYLCEDQSVDAVDRCPFQCQKGHIDVTIFLICKHNSTYNNRCRIKDQYHKGRYLILDRKQGHYKLSLKF